MMTVLITGASSGIGAGLAKSFAADGHLVIACGRDASRLRALQQFSPNITVQGGSDVKGAVMEAAQLSMAELERLFRRLMDQQQRRSN